MLSIFLAEELEQLARESQDVLFLQFFDDNNDERRNTAAAIFRGLILQLLWLNQNCSITFFLASKFRGNLYLPVHRSKRSRESSGYGP